MFALSTPYTAQAPRLQPHGHEVDVANFAALESALQSVTRSLPSIHATRPNIQATANLHKLLPNDNLDFFIMLSSIVSILGSSGQAAYAAGNSHLDALGRHRASKGLPARKINVGLVRDVGFVSGNAKVAASLEARCFASMDMVDVLAIPNYAITHPTASGADIGQLCIGLSVSPATVRGSQTQGLDRAAWWC